MKLEKFNVNDLEEYTPKLQLSKILGISRTTVHEIHKIANSMYDFNSDYPYLDFFDNSEPYTKSSMTKYQCWVIWSILIFSRRVPRNKLYYVDKNKCVIVYPQIEVYLTKREYDYQMNKKTNVSTISTLVNVA